MTDKKPVADVLKEIAEGITTLKAHHGADEAMLKADIVEYYNSIVPQRISSDHRKEPLYSALIDLKSTFESGNVEDIQKAIQEKSNQSKGIETKNTTLPYLPTLNRDLMEITVGLAQLSINSEKDLWTNIVTQIDTLQKNNNIHEETKQQMLLLKQLNNENLTYKGLINGKGALLVDTIHIINMTMPDCNCPQTQKDLQTLSKNIQQFTELNEKQGEKRLSNPSVSAWKR